MRAAWIEIDLGQIRKNIRFLKSRINPSTRFMGVIKADGYGYGAIPIARILEQEGADAFAVALVQEGIELRQYGFLQPILLLGHTFSDDYPLLVQYNLTATISTLEQAQQLNDYALSIGARVTVHLKVDTGMGRLGFPPNADLVEIIGKITAMPGLYVEGIFSHLATAPQLSDTSYCFGQFAKFEEVLTSLADAGIHIPIRHISNSGATILFPQMQLDMVRPGTAIYGLYAGDELASIPGVENYPALEVKAKLAYVKPVPAGTRVSYTGSFETKRPSVLGVVPLGYVDGIFRRQANHGEVLVHGKRCPMVGNVCMDQFVIDITDLKNPREGDEVVLIGRQGGEYISAEEIGAKSGTISIEVICDLGGRMPIIYKDNG